MGDVDDRRYMAEADAREKEVTIHALVAENRLFRRRCALAEEALLTIKISDGGWAGGVAEEALGAIREAA